RLAVDDTAALLFGRIKGDVADRRFGLLLHARLTGGIATPVRLHEDAALLALEGRDERRVAVQAQGALATEGQGTREERALHLVQQRRHALVQCSRGDEVLRAGVAPG